MTYNQRETCISAISSLLAQTLALDLIIVSDDCSTDGTYEVITDHFSKNGKPSNVELYQSEKNLGFIPHFNALLKNHCRDDDLIFYNAGDDISETSRIEEFYREYLAKGKPRYFLGHSYVTSFGSGTEEILVPPIESIKDNRELCLIASAYHIGASQVFTGALFFDFGPILFDDCYEDLTLGYRALLKDAYHFIPKALLRYRVGGLSSWQKNPLEKKRGRLKSTLTQRAVDSMRSGDFEALTSIQDCYSQYGFSLIPHPDRVRVTVISEETQTSQLPTYSITDHFPVISNVCETKWETPTKFLESTNLTPPDQVWIVASRMESRKVRQILSKSEYPKGTNLVIDLGLAPSLKAISPSLNIEHLTMEFIAELSNVSIHTANAHLFNELKNYPALSSTTYLPPLQNIDGTDPIIQCLEEKKGLIVVIGESTQSRKTLSVLEKSYADNRLDWLKLNTILLTDAELDGWITNQEGVRDITDVHTNNEDLSHYSYMVIISGNSQKHSAAIDYWWGLGARNCIPVFINAESVRMDYLIHGDDCLYVSSTVDAWNAALELVNTAFHQLHKIAARARSNAYFNRSIQKKIAHVAWVIGRNRGIAPFYDKFLPL